MAGVLQASSKWKIVQVIGESEHKPTTVNVYAAKIDPQIANSLIRELNSKAPLPLLCHVKRVQRSIEEGTVKLSIILCTVDRADLSEEIGADLSEETGLPSLVSEIVDRYCLQPFMTSVAEHPARTREEWEMQCQLWPTSYHPNSGQLAVTAGLSQADEDNMRCFMQLAVEEARVGCQDGQLANVAIIVDPALGAVIARGYDSTAAWCASLSSGLHSRGCQNGEKLNATLSYGGHPLRHAVMEAIQMAAVRDIRLWPAEDANAMEGNGGGNDCSTVMTRKRQRSFEDKKVHASIVNEDTSLRLHNPEVLRAPVTTPNEIARSYLCTDCDLYVTHEPCAMCAMAMVHQRIRRVIYGIPNAAVGALGSRYKLHGIPSLNHHYTVFQVSLSEADLS